MCTDKGTILTIACWPPNAGINDPYEEPTGAEIVLDPYDEGRACDFTRYCKMSMAVGSHWITITAQCSIPDHSFHSRPLAAPPLPAEHRMYSPEELALRIFDHLTIQQYLLPVPSTASF